MLKCKWRHNRQIFYDGITSETVHAMYPIFFYEEFLGVAGGGPFGATTVWHVVDVGDATEAIVDDSANGQFLLHLAATEHAQDAVLYHGNNKTFDVGSGLIFECRLDMAVEMGTGVTAVWGMAGDHNLDKDAVTEQAWFRLDASAALLVESDDGNSTNNDDVATGITLSAGTYNIFRIDFTDISDVGFYVDGVRVAASTTFDMSDLSSTEQQMQPYFSVDKPSSTELGDLNIDYVKIWQDRS